MLKTLRLSLLLPVLVSCALAPAQRHGGDRGAAIDAFVEAERQRQRIAGVAVAVVHKGEVIRAAGYGLANIEHQIPVKPETIFQSGSVGKQFTAALVMTLVEEGRLALADPAGKYLPGAPKSWRGITLRHLLTHTSGLQDWPEGFDLTRDYTEDQLVKEAFKVELAFAPGARWSYSNVAYCMLGVIVGKVTGRFYGDLLRERIFLPLGMNTARVITEHDLVPNRSSGYELVDGELKNQSWVSPTLNTTADGSLYFSALDMVAWDRGLREGKILKAETWQQVYTPVRLNSGNPYPYGFGWGLHDIAGQKLREHGGAWQGFRTHIWRYLGDDLSIIVLANSGQTNTQPFGEGIAALFNPALAPSFEPIADTEPRVTAQLKILLADAAKGALKRKDFAHVSAALLKALNDYHQNALKSAGELQGLELLKRAPEGDDVEYLYRATYPDAAFRVTFTVVAASGKATLVIARPIPQATLIRNARVIDGTGAAERDTDVRIVDGRVFAVGTLTPEPKETVLDARGLVLAPGFIDTHSHHDWGLAEEPQALAAVSQGITTIITGQDGASVLPLSKQFAALEAKPAAVNLAAYVGHNSIRAKVMGKNYRRAATAAEITRMRALVEQGMKDGALGLSTGLEYDPGIYSSSGEVLELAKVAAAHGGRYISHIRSEDRQLWQALDELIEIGRVTGMPVQVSHIKLAMRALWGKGDELVARLDRARAAGVRLSADIYPYTMWQSTLTVLYPERNFADRAETEFILKHIAAPQDLLIARYALNPAYAGRTVEQIAAERKTDPATTLMTLIADAEKAGADESVVATGMDERDIAAIMRWPHSNICSDGALTDAHPRGRGSYPRVLARYVREGGVLSLEEAVRKMTSLPAANMGLRQRGNIAPGYWADLVLFDPETIVDHATAADPAALSTGVDTVWVNGKIVYANSTATGRHPGQVLRSAP